MAKKNMRPHLIVASILALAAAFVMFRPAAAAPPDFAVYPDPATGTWIVSIDGQSIDTGRAICQDAVDMEVMFGVPADQWEVIPEGAAKAFSWPKASLRGQVATRHFAYPGFGAFDSERGSGVRSSIDVAGLTYRCLLDEWGTTSPVTTAPAPAPAPPPAPTGGNPFASAEAVKAYFEIDGDATVVPCPNERNCYAVSKPGSGGPQPFHINNKTGHRLDGSLPDGSSGIPTGYNGPALGATLRP